LELLHKIDTNKDGMIEWGEFLQAMYDWLNSLGILKELQGDSSSSV